MGKLRALTPIRRDAPGSGSADCSITRHLRPKRNVIERLHSRTQTKNRRFPLGKRRFSHDSSARSLAGRPTIRCIRAVLCIRNGRKSYCSDGTRKCRCKPMSIRAPAGMISVRKFLTAGDAISYEPAVTPRCKAASKDRRHGSAPS